MYIIYIYIYNNNLSLSLCLSLTLSLSLSLSLSIYIYIHVYIYIYNIISWPRKCSERFFPRFQLFRFQPVFNSAIQTFFFRFQGPFSAPFSALGLGSIWASSWHQPMLPHRTLLGQTRQFFPFSTRFQYVFKPFSTGC